MRQNTSMLYLGIDIGGTSIKCAFVNEEGTISHPFTMKFIKGAKQDETLSKLGDLINANVKAVQAEGFEVGGIGIGCPGSINSRSGICCFSGNLGWNNAPVAEMIRQATGLPTKVTNDANAAMLGEAKFGVGKQYNNLVLLTLGTGVGGGLFLDGKLYEGNEGKGTELGHMVIERGGRQCTCGLQGCLEAYAAWAEYFDTILEAPLYSLTVSHNGGMVTLGTNTLPQHYLFSGALGDTLTLVARSVFDEGTAADLDITGFNHLQHVYIDSVEVPLESIHQVSTSMFIRYTLPVAYNGDHQVRFEFSDTPVVGIEEVGGQRSEVRAYALDGRIVVEGAEGSTAALYPGDGRQLSQWKVDSGKWTANVSSLPTGVYILSLDGNGQKIVIKN
jgi:hypothetical protein